MAESQQKIVPHLWFDKEAREAARFHCAVFPDSSIANVSTLHDAPSGDCDLVSFNLLFKMKKLDLAALQAVYDGR